MWSDADTIFAPVTGCGRAGVAIIRISGPRAGAALAAITRRTGWEPRRAAMARLRASNGDILDHALCIWFAGPASFTGEDVAELHVHGGSAVVVATLEALARIGGLRVAEPGEFTRRAFEHGKLDLTQAEALADLVAAETAAQRRQALGQLEGALGALYESWRERIVRATARLEAMIDFADEDLPEDLDLACRSEVEAVRREILAHLADGERGQRIRDGVSIVLVGPPNAGKSSLLNALARRDAAIVDATPGTTRDVIEIPMDLGGFRVLVADTAGLRDGEGSVEREGVRRSLARAGDADLRIGVFDGALWPSFDQRTAEVLNGSGLAVVNKSDLGRVHPPARVGAQAAVIISALTGSGIPELLDQITGHIQQTWGGGSGPVVSRVRHRQQLQSCADALTRFGEANACETAAEELRAATSALGRITGRVDIEDVLGAIFSEFCIGK